MTSGSGQETSIMSLHDVFVAMLMGDYFTLITFNQCIMTLKFFITQISRLKMPWLLLVSCSSVILVGKRRFVYKAAINIK